MDAQEPRPSVSVRGLMTPTEFREAGLHKLTAHELAALDRWFIRTALTLLGSEHPTGVARSSGFEHLEGAVIVADDGQFLGKITRNCVDGQSLGNQVGRYGSLVSSTSIFNEVGRYGGPVSRMSPFNPVTSVPPRVMRGNQFFGYLTVNQVRSPRIDPHMLIGWIRSICG